MTQDDVHHVFDIRYQSKSKVPFKEQKQNAGTVMKLLNAILKKHFLVNYVACNRKKHNGVRFSRWQLEGILIHGVSSLVLIQRNLMQPASMPESMH